MNRVRSITKKLVVLFMVFAALVMLSACSNATFGELSIQGDDVINNICKNCHGVDGVGGFAPSLDKRLGCTYQDARQIYEKMRSDMPRNNPGSLSTLEYRQALSYVLLKNALANEGDIFKVGALSDIALPECPP